MHYVTPLNVESEWKLRIIVFIGMQQTLLLSSAYEPQCL